jgi:hypothetical protein
VKGYSQRQGVDYEEVFAHVAELEVVRLMLALSAHEEWEIHHMNVKSAFLNGDLNEKVFVLEPPGFVRTRRENQVLELKKALSGLHQAPRAWNQKLDESLTSLGFLKYPSDLVRQNHLRNEGFVSQDHIMGFSVKREYTNTTHISIQHHI